IFFFFLLLPPPCPTLFPYTTLFRSLNGAIQVLVINRVFIVPNTWGGVRDLIAYKANPIDSWNWLDLSNGCSSPSFDCRLRLDGRSEEHTSELQSQSNLVCRLLLEKK